MALSLVFTASPGGLPAGKSGERGGRQRRRGSETGGERERETEAVQEIERGTEWDRQIEAEGRAKSERIGRYKDARGDRERKGKHEDTQGDRAVSYTHLTLPTKLSV